MDNVRAYGAGLAGAGFDPNVFFRKPTVVFRSIALVLGGLLWFCISKGGWHKVSHHQVCLYGSSSSTCSFASALGFFSLVAAGVLLLADAKFDQISAVPTRKKVVLADLLVSGIFSGIYFIAFFTFWSKFSSFEVEEPMKTSYAKLGILFSLFSTITWSGASFFAWRRHMEGSAEAFQTNFDDQFGAIAGEVQDGYGYGGNSEGIGAVGGPVSVGNSSYQAGAPPAPVVVPSQPPNPFVGGEGYGY